MKEYIRKHKKSMIGVAVLIVCVIAFIGTNELIAQMMPDASELQYVNCEVKDGSIYEYTGEAVKPEFNNLVFYDKNGNEIVKSGEEISIESYIDNVEVGMGSVEVSLDGYRGTITIENAFLILPQQVNALQLTHDSMECIQLDWEKTGGAEGYIISKSTDNGATYNTIQTIAGGDTTTYQDTEIACNTTYTYKVSAFAEIEQGQVYGTDSDAAKRLTRLAAPVLSSAQGVSYNSIQIQWELLEGASGYQIYRSTEENGTYECIGEIEDGAATTYTDATCECGVAYYYQIKARQTVDGEQIYGDASGSVVANTTPDQISISGYVSKENTQVTLNWRQSSGAQGYEIYRSTGYSSNYGLVKKIEQGNTLTWSDTGLDKDTEYSYRIRPYLVVNGKTITGDYSNIYTKEVVIISDYAQTGMGNLSSVVQYAGIRYVPGGYTPNGWDCSGFTKWALQEYYGVTIPKPAASQGAGGTSISLGDRSQWQPGDILAYSENGRISHVALYLGDGQMMHALSEEYGTIIQSVDYYEQWDKDTKLVAVKRYY